MENQLAIVDGNDVFTMEEQSALNQEIDRIIRAHQNNRQGINRLVFECRRKECQTAELAEFHRVSGFPGSRIRRAG